MTMDVILNLLLISYFGYPLDILAAGNLGYMLAHVFALTAFLLLRRDRPNWPRPIRLAGRLGADRGAAARRSTSRSSCSAGSSTRGSDKYGYGWDKTRIGLIVLRGRRCCSTSTARSSRTRTGVPLREDRPEMPPRRSGRTPSSAATTAAPAA